MKLSQYLLACAASLFTLCCCQNKDKDSVRWDIAEKKQPASSSARTLTTQAQEPGALIAIADWCIDDSLLVCQSTHTPAAFYRFRLTDFSCKDSFGLKGQGPEEFLYPRLAQKSSQEYLVMDNGKNRFCCLDKKDGSMGESWASPLNHLVNALQTYRYPLISYADYRPDVLTWLLQDAKTGQVADSLVFRDKEEKGQAGRYELNWRFRGDRLVMAFFYLDQFFVTRVLPDNRLERGKLLQAPSSDREKIYYTDLACADSCIYLLSQRSVDVQEQTGVSDVEVYDYEGRPLALYRLDIVAEKMLYDAARRRLLFTCPLDDRIYWADL